MEKGLDESSETHDGLEQIIRQHAGQCQRGFMNILYDVHSNEIIIKRLPKLFRQSPDTPRPIFSLLDFRDEFEQFRIWTNNIGVFASDHASLDYRLREASDVKEGISRLLISLNKDLAEVLLRSDRKYDEENSFSNPVSDDDSCSDSDLNNLSDIDLTGYEIQGRLEHISGTINKLSHLARVIRTSGIRSRMLKAGSYIHYEDGVNQTDLFEQKYLPTVLQHRFGVPETILTRLCQAISLRRRRFMYYRKHQKRLAAYNTEGSEVLRKTDPVPILPVLPTRDVQFKDVSAVVLPKVSIGDQSGVTQLTRATTFRESMYHKPAPSTMIASTAKVAMTSTEIPPAPQPAPGATHFQCPYCCLLVEIKKASPIAWKKHVIHDLQPFVCIDPSCPDSNVVLESWTDWVEHHKWTHAFEWWCEGVDGDHDPAKFVTAKEYSDHLLNLHLSILSVQNVEKRLNTTGGPSQEPFPHCPFCDFRSELAAMVDGRDRMMVAKAYQAKLQSHIFEHLLSMFVLALPERTDVESGNDDVDSSTRRRSSMDLESLSSFAGSSKVSETASLGSAKPHDKVQPTEWLIDAFCIYQGCDKMIEGVSKYCSVHQEEALARSSSADRQGRSGSATRDDPPDVEMELQAEKAGQLIVGAEVIYKLPKNLSDGSGCGQQCIIRKIWQEKAPVIYEIQELEPGLDGELEVYRTYAEDLIPLPQPGFPLPILQVGTDVYARYPNTDFFYRAKIRRIQKEEYAVEFEGDINDMEVSVEKRFVLEPEMSVDVDGRLTSRNVPLKENPMKQPQKRLLACHFHKISPEQFSLMRDRRFKSCATGFSNAEVISDHLKRVHMPEFYCQRCFVIFDNEIDLNAHLTAIPCDHHYYHFLTIPFISSTEQMKAVLQSKPVHISIERFWYDIWVELFPDKPQPSSIYRERLDTESLRPEHNAQHAIVRDVENSSTQSSRSSSVQQDMDLVQHKIVVLKYGRRKRRQVEAILRLRPRPTALKEAT